MDNALATTTASRFRRSVAPVDSPGGRPGLAREAHARGGAGAVERRRIPSGRGAIRRAVPGPRTRHLTRATPSPPGRPRSRRWPGAGPDAPPPAGALTPPDARAELVSV